MAVPRMTKEELKERLDAATNTPVVVDVRLKYPYEHSTVMVPGAIRMSPGSLDTARLPRDRDIVLYDSDPDELVSSRVAAELIRLGYRAFALKGGIAEWMAAKLPTDTKPTYKPLNPMTGTPKG